MGHAILEVYGLMNRDTVDDSTRGKINTVWIGNQKSIEAVQKGLDMLKTE